MIVHYEIDTPMPGFNVPATGTVDICDYELNKLADDEDAWREYVEDQIELEIQHVSFEWW